MPLLPTARQPEAPPAGSRNPFEQGLTSPLGAIQAGEARTRIGLAGQAGSAVSRAALQTADAVERIESSKRAIAIQTQLSDMNEQVAAANEVGELAGFDPSVESVVMPHFQGFDFNPAPMIQRFGPQIARSRLVLEDKRRALIRRDMDATMEASRGAAIREGNIGSLEAHVELVANNGDIFGNAVAKQMAEDEAKIVAEGIITKEIAESETAADAYIDILRDEGLAAEDPLVSLLPAERRLALLNTAVGSRAFKRRERMVEDEKAILAELDWAIHRGAINQETPALMARFGQVVGHENLLPTRTSCP
jgi:hypothetical protein